METITDGKMKIPSPRAFLLNKLRERVRQKNTLPVYQGPWKEIEEGKITYDIDNVTLDNGDFLACELIIEAEGGSATVPAMQQLLYQFLCTLGFDIAADSMYDCCGFGYLHGTASGGVRCSVRLEFEMGE